MALAFSSEQFHLLAAAGALIGALIIQIGTNFANGYFDFVKALTTSIDQLQATGWPCGTVMNGLYSTFAALLPFAIYLRFEADGRWPSSVSHLSSAEFYTGGPKPLGYLGLGDLFVLIFFGPVAVWGTDYVQSQTLSWIPAVVGFGPGAISTAILVVNNLRDKDTDVHTGKNTLAVRFGERFARIEYTACLITAAVIPLVLAWLKLGPWLAGMASLFLIPSNTGTADVDRVRQRLGQKSRQNRPTSGDLLGAFSIGWCLG